MATVNRIITTKRGEVNALSKLFGVSRMTIWNALTGQVQTENSLRIRKAALNRGAVELRQ